MPFLFSLFATFFRSVDGTLLNTLTVIIGGVIGSPAGDRLPSRIHEALFGALGLFTVLIGLLDAFTTKNPLLLLGALLLGVIIGEALNIERGLQYIGDLAQRRLTRATKANADVSIAGQVEQAQTGSKKPDSRSGRFGEAFITSSLVFCVGPLTILGALDNGLNGDTTKLAIKATLDGFAALAFGATLGWGVLLSALTVLFFQGTLSLLARALAPALGANPETLTELVATGGLLLVAIGLKLLNLRDLRVGNWLPALVMSPLLVAALALWQSLIK